MSSALLKLFKSEHFLIGVQAPDAKTVIELLGMPLVESGEVTRGFIVDVWEREQSFPTGLPTEPIAIAIPHADPDHISASAICVGILQTPVEFRQMGTDNSTKLKVHLVFLLAIKEREKQVEIIQQLVTLIQAPSLVTRLTEIKGAEEGLNLIRQTLNEA